MFKVVTVPKEVMTRVSPNKIKRRQGAPNKTDPDGSNTDQYELREVRPGGAAAENAAEGQRAEEPKDANNGGAEGYEAAATGGDEPEDREERDGLEPDDASRVDEPEFVRLCRSIDNIAQPLPRCCRRCRKKHDVPRYFLIACLLLTHFAQIITVGSICPGDVRFFWALLGVTIASAVILVVILAIHWIIPCLTDHGHHEQVSWLNDTFHKMMIVLCALSVAIVIIVCMDALNLS